MSAREHPPLVEGDPKAPFDLDRVQELVVALGAFAFYVIGSIGGAFTLGVVFDSWVGFLLLMFAGILPGVWVLRKSAQRRESIELAALHHAHQERTRFTVGDPPVPRRP